MPDLRETEDALRAALRKIERHTSFVEAMAQHATGADVRVDRTGTAVNVAPQLSGAALRAWAGDHWVEVAASGLDAAALSEAAEGLVVRLRGRKGSAPPPGASAEGRLEKVHPPRHPMSELSTEARIARCRELRQLVLHEPGITDGVALIRASEDSRLYLNSVGGYRYQVLPRVVAGATAIAMENGRVQYDHLREGGLGGVEIVDSIHPERISAMAKSATEMLKARTPPAGAMTVVLDPSTTGTLAHESFGHGTEADQFVRQRSYLQPILGQMVGPEHLSIVDDGSFPNGWGSIYFDDEGTSAKKNYLIDHGRFVGVLHDRATAAELGGTPTGNARRSDFLSRQWVRMTNTYVEPSDWSVEEIYQEAKDGVLLQTFTSGIEDPLGGLMQIKVLKGRRIEHGEPTELLSSMALSGRVLDVLGSVRAVSRNPDLSMETGFCGKGHSDYLPAGSGGAYLLTQAVVGPA